MPVEDELVAHLLLLHGLHPVPVRERVRGALDEVRPYLVAHGGGVELLGVDDGVVRLRLEGACNGCPSSALTLKLAVEEAIARAAPDVERIEAEGADGALRTAADRDRMPGAAGGLMRLAQRATVEREAALEHCELCGRRSPPTHRHVLELATRDVKCACRPCGLLFERAEQHEADPDRRPRPTVDDVWEICGCRSTSRSSSAPTATTKAFYPSPMGPTESLLTVRCRRRARGRRRGAARQPRARRAGSGSCRSTSAYALVGLIRTHWRGLTGGADVWRELDQFFDGLDREAR